MLPHEGRQGPAPACPLPNPNPAELAYWAELWTMPQAIEWERMRCERDVARFVRFAILADETGDPKMSTEARQLDAKIGVSPKAMRDLRWETDEPRPDDIETEEESPSESQTPAAAPRVFVPPPS